MTKRFFLDWSNRKKAFFLAVLLGWSVLIAWIFSDDEDEEKVKAKTPTVAPVTGSFSSEEDQDTFITRQEAEKAARVAEKFIPIYTSYDFNKAGEMVDKIQPYVTDSFFEQEKLNASQVRPTAELQGFRFVKMDQPRIQQFDNQLYWTALVIVEAYKAGGKKDLKRYNYVIQLVNDGAEWKIQEVNFREFTEEDEKQE
jgi:hypothetical protein